MDPSAVRSGAHRGTVCNDCGFIEVGVDGCAPDLDDLIDPAPEHVLLQVRSTDDGVERVGTE